MTLMPFLVFLCYRGAGTVAGGTIHAGFVRLVF